MTQEELDALMADGIEEESSDNVAQLDEVESEDLSNEDITLESSEIEEEPILEDGSKDEVIEEEIDDSRVDPSAPTPPPANDEHKVVEQLDDVTRESEAKANEVFDKLDEISLIATNIKNSITEQKSIIEKNVDIFERLSAKFSDIESFQTALEDNQKALTKLQEVEAESDNITNSVMDTMDIMQYQDIHRQKIERVINVMRALSHYMHSLFDSNIKDDEHRTSSAITIDSDNAVSEDELEALLESFAKK
jgi:chemotaxis regulatin CheY-phosphate phosphatase CheZ